MSWSAKPPICRDCSREHGFNFTAVRTQAFDAAPLTALAHGVVLAGAPASGTSPALALGRALGPRFIAASRDVNSVAEAVQRALEVEAPELSAYQATARERLRRYRERVIVKRLRDEVLPRLLSRRV